LTSPNQNPVCISPVSHHVPHAPPIPFFLIWSPEYLASSTSHKGLRYIVFPTPVTSSLLGPNIFLSFLHPRF
jgi:hypothetical protein